MLHKSHVFRCRQDVLARPGEHRSGHRHSWVELSVLCTHKYPKAAAGGKTATSLSHNKLAELSFDQPYSACPRIGPVFYVKNGYYLRKRLRTPAAIPSKPVPRSTMLAGSGIEPTPTYPVA